jgi:formylglycine-generating enzyme required for sulfatase activity
MISIPGGTFVDGLGEPDSEHVLETFLLDESEVSIAAYASCVADGGCTEPGEGEGCNWGEAGKVDHPANCVTWFQAEDYCEWAGRRLPTEWEWEWAARGREEARVFPWGGAEPVQQACWSETSGGETCARGSFSPAGDSRDGVRDMAGNVWEWTSDWFDDTQTNRVRRGGGFGETNTDFLKADLRLDFGPADIDPAVGFRCAQTP